MQVADRVDDDEDEEEHGGARKADAVVREHDVLLGHVGEEDIAAKSKGGREKGGARGEKWRAAGVPDASVRESRCHLAQARA